TTCAVAGGRCTARTSRACTATRTASTSASAWRCPADTGSSPRCPRPPARVVEPGASCVPEGCRSRCLHSGLVHRYDADAKALGEAVLDYTQRRLRMDPVPLDGPRTPAELDEVAGATITAK